MVAGSLLSTVQLMIHASCFVWYPLISYESTKVKPVASNGAGDNDLELLENGTPSKMQWYSVPLKHQNIKKTLELLKKPDARADAFKS